ncbi:hypothetical protein Slin_1821 [Sporocytophaga myxococcoides]|uniref:NADAR domain-containing protein n=1 Tax=Sporocytophaga myxococcoides TaxID=153721 RepID=A0A098LH25_9BACT|nr:NADAR family protein [Sporocytophaga myxococcoides]GAL85727.1 hypothetical protein Slin_1821 [Sporocytophaga myxococcoides]
MTYNLEWLIENYKKGKRSKFLFFWGHQKSKNGDLTPTCFSQWWSVSFKVDGVIYKTAEHWMMGQKALLFRDTEAYEKILIAGSPKEAKAIGRQVLNYQEDIWADKRFGIVVAGNLHKFSQHADLKDYLLSTKDKIIVEASPVDKIWGIGLSADSDKADNPLRWNGLNLLGFALMEVRDKLRSK